MAYYGGDGDQSQSGGAFTEFYGGNGADYLIGNTGASNDFFGGYGNDVLLAETTGGVFTGTGTLANPFVVTAVGATSGANYMYGDVDSDVIYGYAGNDTLYGGQGDDGGIRLMQSGFYWQAGLYGGAGVDYLDGGQGNDDLYGGDDSDYLVGGQGNDNMYGGNGADNIVADSGVDLIYGGAGDDKIYASSAYFNTTDYIYAVGDAGADTIICGNNADYLYGGLDGDILFGNAGNDSVYGGQGIDSVFGAVGNDYLYGGTEGDYFNLFYDATVGETDYILDYALADFIFLPKWTQNDISFSASGGYAYASIAGASGQFYTLGVNGLTAAQLQSEIIYV
jgi:Ca2+-binding RTX toxin-like protein